ncbi:16S rRNA (uracil(1498)-N(3))-methyltransferase [Cochleicola gelatinilyticus]|uniref:Ribosomal RNA small subunit methyltransferase E n=1 Tax=Cochleicola gelatinilyticus TaxID=1763537 RepID=A0A167GV34_9FLAO|nr:16S rRNA (uracil(1498)-N(3))-methyltransferase [Cochleicola gelatinilyticus]OAB77934.1 16S rRNA methyltransferase [Cochleicola gelatinilyticus]
MNLFYTPHTKETDTEIVFEKEESRHLGKVLRKKEGDRIHCTNGSGFFFEVELISVHQKQCVAKILKAEKQAPLPYSLHMAVAPTKLNDRFEWFLEKATEIGITEITPIICDHSERKVIKPERYEKILVSAMKQSLKAYLPKLNEAIPLEKFLAISDKETLSCIAHCEETNKKSFKSQLRPKTSVVILIGPEGDFSTSEIENAIASNFIPVSLGNSRLRTETAAVVACHSVAFVNE